MKLLFICTHNRCRSILAEAIANHLSQGDLQAFSAGSSPQDRVHPLSLKYLKDNGIDATGLVSQSWDEFENSDPDAIITLCDDAAQETCPVWFDKTVQVHWGLVDPSRDLGDLSRERLAFNRTIDVLSRRVSSLTEPSNIVLRGEPLRVFLTNLAQTIV